MNDAMELELEQVQETFINESLDLLQEMEEALHQLETDPADPELINAVFRAAHTIKGSAGLFGFELIVSFTHRLENILDRVRDGDVHMSLGLVTVLLECRDQIEELIELLDTDDEDALSAAHAQSQKLVQALQQQADGERAQDVSDLNDPSDPVAVPLEHETRLERDEGHDVENDNWHISLRFHPDVLRDGMDPLSFLRYLATLGEIVDVVTLTYAMPDAPEMDPETCYIGLEIVFQSDADKQTIMDVFEFIEEQSLVSVLPPHSKISEYAQLLDQLQTPNDDCRIGELLIKVGALTARELQKALTYQHSQADPQSTKKPLGEILVDQGAVDPQTVDTALDKQQQIKEKKIKESKLIRVDADRLDQLINLVGELVIAGAGSNLHAHRLGDEELLESSSLVSRLVEEIRDHSLRLRMVPIAETFNRFNRVVRDVSRELGKSIQLEIQGGDTELDKSVAEKVSDPLVHLVRNAIDHGIESAEERLLRGKPEKGTVKLNAYHDAGNVVIEVSDDGAGIAPDKLLSKAMATGLISPEQQLSRPEILRLIMEPGLSTKEQVSNLSGRGVGMDVVKRNVDALRGSIDVESDPGLGTIIQVRLPLTLSIIDGFLVEVGDSSYVIPLDSIVECIEHSDSSEQLSRNGDYINLRGEVLPFLNLRDQFRDQSEAVSRENIVVVQCGDQKAGFVVDALMGEYQTVIKPLGKILSQLSGISGSTILGSGEVAMILDVAALIQQAQQ